MKPQSELDAQLIWMFEQEDIELFGLRHSSNVNGIRSSQSALYVQTLFAKTEEAKTITKTKKDNTSEIRMA